MDESNGNGLFSIISSKTSPSNGGSSIQLPTSMSNDDLSQSLSEYTDADESISAPTEFLAEVSNSLFMFKRRMYCIYAKLYILQAMTFKNFHLY